MYKKLFFLIYALTLGLSAFAAVPVDDSVLRIFNESFKEAREVSWAETKEYYHVSFLKDHIRYMVTYDKKGNFVSARRYYFEEKLPMYILFKVKRKFPGKSIYGVTETMNDEGVEYFITLQDKRSWWIVKVSTRDFLEITDKMLKN
jgi:hypothetical protein